MEKESLAKKAVYKKNIWLKVFIRICVFLMAFSLIGVYVAYMFTPAQTETEEDASNQGTGVEVIVPENIDSENPEDSDAPIMITDGEETDEMDQTMEVQLENGETETIRVGDLSDSLQIE